MQPTDTGRALHAERNDRTGVSGRGAVAQAWGFLFGSVTIGVIAAEVGLTHHAAWVLAPAGAGVLAGFAVLRNVHGRVATATTTAPQRPDVASWWARRGMWWMLLSGLPSWVAIDAAALALHRG